MTRKSYRRKARAKSSKSLAEAVELEEQLRSKIIPQRILHQIEKLHDRLNQLDQMLVENKKRSAQYLNLFHAEVNVTNFHQTYVKLVKYNQQRTSSYTRLHNKLTDFRNKILYLSRSYGDRISLDFPQLHEKWSHLLDMYSQLRLFQSQVFSTTFGYGCEILQKSLNQMESLAEIGRAHV